LFVVDIIIHFSGYKVNPQKLPKSPKIIPKFPVYFIQFSGYNVPRKRYMI